MRSWRRHQPLGRTSKSEGNVVLAFGSRLPVRYHLGDPHVVSTDIKDLHHARRRHPFLVVDRLRQEHNPPEEICGQVAEAVNNLVCTTGPGGIEGDSVRQTVLRSYNKWMPHSKPPFRNVFEIECSTRCHPRTNPFRVPRPHVAFRHPDDLTASANGNV